MLWWPHDDRTIHEIKYHKVTTRRLGGDRTATSRFLQLITSLPYGWRKGAVRALQGCREAAVRFSRHPRQGKNCMPPHGHHKATVRPSYHVLAVWLWRYSIAVSEKSLMSIYKKRKACDDLAACYKMWGRHTVCIKNCKVTVPFGELWLPFHRCKHATSYMWPWHKEMSQLDAALTGVSLTLTFVH